MSGGCMDIIKKWGPQVAARGFTQIPNYLLLLNNFLSVDSRLKPLDLLILIQLIGSWWNVEDKPFPSAKTLAMRCGASERQVYRSISSLESIPLIKKVKRSQKGIIASNSYDLQPLVDILAEAAKVYPTDHPRKIRREHID
jgi:hypothetical protein